MGRIVGRWGGWGGGGGGHGVWVAGLLRISFVMGVDSLAAAGSPGFQKQLLRQLLRKQHTRGGSFSQKIESANPAQLS